MHYAHMYCIPLYMTYGLCTLVAFNIVNIFPLKLLKKNNCREAWEAKLKCLYTLSESEDANGTYIWLFLKHQRKTLPIGKSLNLISFSMNGPFILLFIILCDMVQILTTFTRVKAHSHQVKVNAQVGKQQGTGTIDQIKKMTKTKKTFVFA